MLSNKYSRHERKNVEEPLDRIFNEYIMNIIFKMPSIIITYAYTIACMNMYRVFHNSVNLYDQKRCHYHHRNYQFLS